MFAKISCERIFMMLLVFSLRVDGSFHIERSGIFKVSKGDIGIRFFLNVANDEPYKISVVKGKQPICCWEVEVGDKDCESMELFGGFTVEIEKKATKNVTYTFPNIYPLDRIGKCRFHLKQGGVGSSDKLLIHTVSFDTSLDTETSNIQTTFGGGQVYKQCKGIDENLRDNCKPFNCAKKYNGYRSYFQKTTGKCVKVNKCSTQVGTDDLPTSAFDTDNNRCKGLIPKKLTGREKEAADDILDKSPLAAERNAFVDVDPQEIVVDCKNGFQQGHYCRCQKGWKTVSIATPNGGVKMDWCSKKVKIKNKQVAYKHVRGFLFFVSFLKVGYKSVYLEFKGVSSVKLL